MHTSWLCTSGVEELNLELTKTHPASGQGGTWIRGLRITSPALSPLGHAAYQKNLYFVFPIYVLHFLKPFTFVIIREKSKMTSDSWVIESLSAHHQDKKKKITKTFLVFTSRKLHWLQYLVWGNTTAFLPWLCPEQKITFFLHILFFPFLYYQRSNKNIGNYDWEDCSISDLVSTALSFQACILMVKLLDTKTRRVRTSLYIKINSTKWKYSLVSFVWITFTF